MEMAQNDLTPEQRQQIFLEEKARMEIRKELGADETLRTVRIYKSNGIAAVLSLIIPGAGQMYKDKVGAGFFWLFGVALGYVLFIIPGVIAHICCIANAYEETEVGAKGDL